MDYDDEKVTVVLERVKKEVRALLISSKHGCTPKKLLDDYLQVLGENLPFQRFGYSDFMDFIQSIPDVVSVCYSRKNITLYGVSNTKTKKIHDLVSKQRNSKKAKVTSEWTTVGPRLAMVTEVKSPPPFQGPTVPAGFKTKLKELMFSYPNGISLKDFDEAFAKRYHHYISYHNWGFKSLEGMIDSVPDIFYIHTDKVRQVKVVKRVYSQPAKKERNVSGKEENKENDKNGSIDWYFLAQQRKEQLKEKEEMEVEEDEAVREKCSIQVTHTSELRAVREIYVTIGNTHICDYRTYRYM